MVELLQAFLDGFVIGAFSTLAVLAVVWAVWR